MKERKLAFFEIGRVDTGDGYHLPLPVEMQEAFEQIQKAVDANRGKAKVVLTIEVHPRKSSKDEYGEINYEIKKVLPVKKSMRYTTKLNERGIVTSTGKSELDVDQLNLDFNQKLYKLTEK